MASPMLFIISEASEAAKTHQSLYKQVKTSTTPPVPCGMWGQWARGLGCADAFHSHRSRGDEIHEIYESHRTWSLFFGRGCVFLKVTEAPACAGVGWTGHGGG